MNADRLEAALAEVERLEALVSKQHQSIDTLICDLDDAWTERDEARDRIERLEAVVEAVRKMAENGYTSAYDMTNDLRADLHGSHREGGAVNISEIREALEAARDTPRLRGTEAHAEARRISIARYELSANAPTWLVQLCDDNEDLLRTASQLRDEVERLEEVVRGVREIITLFDYTAVYDLKSDILAALTEKAAEDD